MDQGTYSDIIGNVPMFTYPVTNVSSSDISNGNAASVSYATYTGTYTGGASHPDGGDAKWVFTPVPATKGLSISFPIIPVSASRTRRLRSRAAVCAARVAQIRQRQRDI